MVAREPTRFEREGFCGYKVVVPRLLSPFDDVLTRLDFRLCYPCPFTRISSSTCSKNFRQMTDEILGKTYVCISGTKMDRRVTVSFHLKHLNDLDAKLLLYLCISDHDNNFILIFF